LSRAFDVAAQHLLFEEDGAFKAGSVLSATDAAFQVELASGKRTKVKSSHVLLRFAAPAPAELMQRAAREAEGIDLDFLWECAPQEDFGFEELAREYHGAAPDAVQAASILFRLHGAPVYFHRKGRGRFRPAPADILKAALAAVERKRVQEEQRAAMTAALKQGTLPAPIAMLGVNLIVRPDKNGIEWKALEQAANELQMSPLRLMLARGGIGSAFRWHLESFLLTTFPRGTGFDAALPKPQINGDRLPLADMAAFSIDDSATTEIDDAFSLHNLDADTPTIRVGIHIAAPALAITRGDAIDAVARTRLSTVYAPGMKITMLPPDWIDAYSLNVDAVIPALSLYVEVGREDLLPRAFETRVERVRIAANLRHDVLDDVVTPEAVAAGRLDCAFGRELLFLHGLARALLAERERVRGKPEPLGRVDYTFRVDAAPGEGERGGEFDIEHGRVDIVPRKRGAPLDLIVAELMILANSHWGGWLAAKKVPAIYRSQSFSRGVGKVRMSTTPAPHEGMGVAQYAWCTSPLRRFVDLVNQRQLIAAATGSAPAYAANDAELFAIVSSFEAAYASYAQFQERLERYWCLRWLTQEGVSRLAATVLKGDVLRLDGMPFVMRMPGLPELARGQRLELDLLSSDEIELTLEARLRQVLSTQTAVEDIEEEVEIEVDAGNAVPADTDAAPAADAGTNKSEVEEGGANGGGANDSAPPVPQAG
jgi:exoribonuclease-2